MTSAVRPAAAPHFADPEVRLLAAMLRLRRFEEKAGMLYALGTLASPCPLGIGQEGAVAALAAAMEAGEALIALQARPTIELALGGSPAAAFQRMLPGCEDGVGPPALLRLPGEELRRLPRAEALELVASRPGNAVVLSDDAGQMVQVLTAVGARVLPVLILPADRRPADYGLPPGWTLRECDGSNALGVREAVASARTDRHVAVSILTPPYAGHARDGSRRSQDRRAAEDPIAKLRGRLASEGRLRDGDAAELEAVIRDEIAAAARGVSLSCAP